MLYLAEIMSRSVLSYKLIKIRQTFLEHCSIFNFIHIYEQENIFSPSEHVIFYFDYYFYLNFHLFAKFRSSIKFIFHKLPSCQQFEFVCYYIIWRNENSCRSFPKYCAFFNRRMLNWIKTQKNLIWFRACNTA